MTSTAYRPIVPPNSLSANLWTYADAVEWLLDFYGLQGGQERNYRLARKAVDGAYNEIVSNQRWEYYATRFTFSTDAAYSTGTVEYTHSTRTVTLTGGTWPANAALGSVKFDEVTSMVESRVSDTQITLPADQNPGADVASGATFKWFRDTYFLPLDFVKMTDPVDEASAWGIGGLRYVPPADLWRYQFQSGNVVTSPPELYTIDRDQRTTGSVIRLANPPSTSDTYSMMYDRKPRPLKVWKYDSGTIDTTEDSTTVGGNNTTFTDAHVGCVLRISENSSEAPTSPYGDNAGGYNPAWQTRLVSSVTSSTELEVDVALPAAKEGVKYTLSDPIDIDWDICRNYFHRLLELHMAIGSNDHVQKGYKLPQSEKDRRKAQADDGNRTSDIQPPPWASGMPMFTTATIVTDMDA